MGMDFRKIIFFFSIFEGLNAPSYQRQFSFNSQLLFECLSSSFIRDMQTKLMPILCLPMYEVLCWSYPFKLPWKKLFKKNVIEKRKALPLLCSSTLGHYNVLLVQGSYPLVGLLPHKLMNRNMVHISLQLP